MGLDLCFQVEGMNIFGQDIVDNINFIFITSCFIVYFCLGLQIDVYFYGAGDIFSSVEMVLVLVFGIVVFDEMVLDRKRQGCLFKVLIFFYNVLD